jgi:hypothetical protein
MNAWVLEKTKPLGQILVEQEALRSDAHGVLETPVQKHLELHVFLLWWERQGAQLNGR